MIQLPVVVVLVVVMVLPTTAAQSIKDPTAYPYAIGGNVSPTVKVVLAALIFGLFLIAFFSLYLRRYLENPPVETRPPLVIPNIHRLRFRFPRGLDRSVVDSFPVFLYSDVKDLKTGKGALECAVCISEFADDEQLRFLPICHHVFHPNCIDAWLVTHTTCPVCRADLTTVNLDGDSEINHESTHYPIEDSRIDISSQNHHIIQVEDEHEHEDEPEPEPEPVETEHERAAPKLSRSHSTGHSLGENCERYTLRLPEEFRNQILSLKRAKSCGCELVSQSEMDGSPSTGCGGSESEEAQGGRRLWSPDRICGMSELWNFTVTRMPAFIAKSDSAESSSSTPFTV